MIVDNHDIYITQGEADVTHTFKIYGNDGVGVDLSDPGWTVKLYAGKKGLAKIINGESCTIIPDQVNYRGGFQFVFTSVHTANLRGDYEMACLAEHIDGRRFEYPKHPDELFGTLHIQRSLTS